MEISRKKLKKAPLPFSEWELGRKNTNDEIKLIRIIRSAFRRMFDNSTEPMSLAKTAKMMSISTSQRKAWGEFLLNRGIVWEIKLPPRKIEWDGWDFMKRDKCVVARPKGLEGYKKAGSFYIPPEVATRMLVLEELM